MRLTAFDPAILVGAGGALGAIVRATISTRLATPAFPLGTLVVNAGGTLLLSLIVLGGGSDGTTLLVGVGFCGALTTFSSFAHETVRLWEDGRRSRAVYNGLGNLVAAGIAFLAAWAVLWLV